MASTVNLGDLNAFVGLCSQLRVQTPEPIERCLHLVEVVRAYDNAPSTPLLGMTDDQARERVTELAIRSHRYNDLATGMGAGISIFEEGLASEVREETLPHLEDLIVGLQPRFAVLAQPIVVAVEKYGFERHTTPAEVIDLADEEAATAWRAARAASSAIQPIVSFRFMISSLFDVSPTPTEVRHYNFSRGVFDAPDLRASMVNFSAAFAQADNWSLDDGYLAERRRLGHPMPPIDWYALAAGGLRLNSPNEVRSKIAGRVSGNVADRHAAA